MRKLAATAIAAALVLGSIVTIQPASAATATPVPVKLGKTLVFEGRTPTRIKRTVTLERKVGKTWKRVDSVKSASSGYFELGTRSLEHAALYRFHAKDVRLKGKKYREWTTKARSVTTTSISVGLTLAPASVTAGGTITATVSVKKPLKRQAVVLQRRDDDRWLKVGGSILNGTTAAISTPAPASGQFVYRAVVPGKGGAPGASSETVTATVTAAPPAYSGPLAYRVLAATVDAKSEGTKSTTGCGTIRHKQATTATLMPAETGPAKWVQYSKERVGGPNTVVELNPELDTIWKNELAGCKHTPDPVPCELSTTDRPPHDGKAMEVLTIDIAPGASTGTVMFFPDKPFLGYPGAWDSVCGVSEMVAPGSVADGIRTNTVPTSTLLGWEPFTVTSQGFQRWDTDYVGKPADVSVAWTISFTLQRVTPEGEILTPVR